jgi:hypothetical protein
MPEAKDVDVSVNEGDLKIDTYRALMCCRSFPHSIGNGFPPTGRLFPENAFKPFS